jgi:hypothetical protein
MKVVDIISFMRLINFVFPFIFGTFGALHLQIFVVASTNSECKNPNSVPDLIRNLRDQPKSKCLNAKTSSLLPFEICNL